MFSKEEINKMSAAQVHDAFRAYCSGASVDEVRAAAKQFNEYEYFRDSSIATAIHDKYRKIINAAPDVASAYEHMRWNAYMRTEGYIFSGSTDKSTRNDRAKMHHDLVPRHILSDTEAGKDDRMINLSQDSIE